MILRILTLILCSISILHAQSLRSGPMLGYTEMMEAKIWLQTSAAASVYASYSSADMEKPRFTDTLVPLAENAFTAHLLFRNLKPGTTYHYRIYINGKIQDSEYSFKTQSDWAYKTPPPSFKVAMGSCVYVNEPPYDRPGRPYGSNYSIFESIAKKQPDVMLWLGDNTYLRPADWTSRSGYLHRYSHTRQIPEMQKLLATASNYAIWDDHEFGPNDASGSWVLKDVALDVFKLFWANPTYGSPDLKGIHTAFTYNDVDFFLMDNRYHRTEVMNKGTSQIFGREQCDLLIDRLKASKANFKIVVSGGQFLNTAAVFENHARYGEEREYLLSRMDEEGIDKVIFLTGDRHASEVNHRKPSNGTEIWEFTVSPLTSGTANNISEENEHRIENSYISKHNFGVMEFVGEGDNRELIFHFYDASGVEIATYSIKK